MSDARENDRVDPWVLPEFPDEPTPVPWSLYEPALMAAWSQFLDSDASADERLVHQFLEAHPTLVPGAFSMNGPSGWLPWPLTLITKPPLAGLAGREPDFCWIALDSGTVYAVLVEIESPAKKWWHASGTTGQIDHTGDLSHALGQFREWRDWFDRYGVERFVQDYRIPADLLADKAFVVQYVLVYGRRTEANRVERLGRMRQHLAKPDEYLMTFDRLNPDPKAAPLLTARLRDDGYHVTNVPAPFGPIETAWEWLRTLNGLADAIRNSGLPPTRKAALFAAMARLDAELPQRHPPIRSTGLL